MTDKKKKKKLTTAQKVAAAKKQKYARAPSTKTTKALSKVKGSVKKIKKLCGGAKKPTACLKLKRTNKKAF